ncbi:MAG: type IV pilin [Clostridiaceae bacterium]|nr:type IV pilin [Clostridiaceae bacterium]
MMKFRENEDAVSPVIGVILMVAITVILAAVIAAFVFGMGSNIGTTKTVAVTVNQNGDDIILTYHGGADASTLNFLTITVEAGDTVTATGVTDNKLTKMTTNKAGALETTRTAGAEKGLNVGAVMTMNSMGTDKRDHVVVTGHFADGSDHVVLDTFV